MFDAPPLTYNSDENPNDSLWCKVAKVVLTEQGENTLKYIKSYKTIFEILEESGVMPFHFVNNPLHNKNPEAQLKLVSKVFKSL